MYRQGGSAKIEYTCPECGAPATAYISECGYRSSASHVCSAKRGYAVEEDGGRIEGEYRAAVLEQSGTWQLWVSIDGATRLNAMRVLRSVLHWPVGRVSSVTAISPALAWEGTAGEAFWFASAFEKAGVAVEVRRIKGVA
jgi:hypothetical protein